MHSHMERNAIMQWNKKWKAGSDPVLKIVEVFEDLSMTFKMDTTEYYFNISTLSLFTLAPVTVNGRKIHVMSGHSLGRNVLNPKTKTSRKSPPPRIPSTPRFGYVEIQSSGSKRIMDKFECRLCNRHYIAATYCSPEHTCFGKGLGKEIERVGVEKMFNSIDGIKNYVEELDKVGKYLMTHATKEICGAYRNNPISIEAIDEEVHE